MRYLILLLVAGCTITPETLETTGAVLTTAGEVVGDTAPGPVGAIGKIVLIGLGGILSLAGQKALSKK